MTSPRPDAETVGAAAIDPTSSATPGRSTIAPPSRDWVGQGRVVLIVGPSGSGKDTLLRLARKALTGAAAVVFAPRDVTRATGTAEEIAVTAETFDAREASGGYALSWRAHGFAYGIRVDIDHDVASGRIVVLNASRTVLAAARARYRDVTVILIDAPAAVRAARLEARGREETAAVANRLARLPGTFMPGDADVIIENVGPPEDGAAVLVRAIMR